MWIQRFAFLIQNLYILEEITSFLFPTKCKITKLLLYVEKP